MKSEICVGKNARFIYVKIFFTIKRRIFFILQTELCRDETFSNKFRKRFPLTAARSSYLSFAETKKRRKNKEKER